MLNVTSFRDAKTVQIKMKIVGWNVPDVARCDHCECVDVPFGEASSLKFFYCR